jgi:Fic family protein
MVTVRKRILRNRTYYYLEHSLRLKGYVEKRERYLGKSMPKDIEARKKAFLGEIYKEKWYPLLEEIRKGYAQDLRKTPPTGRERNLSAFATVFTYDTQRIEGSALTLHETADLLEKGITPSARPLGDVKEAEAHRAIFADMLQERRDISLALVLRWHHELFRTTRSDIAGRLREHQVAISGSRFVPPLPAEVYPLLRSFFRLYVRSKDSVHPVESAALVHLKFVTIHPFSDGNGRIARLLMNFILNRAGYPMLNIPYAGRSSYYTALERAQTKQMESIFLQWFFRRYVRDHRRYLSQPRRG